MKMITSLGLLLLIRSVRSDLAIKGGTYVFVVDIVITINPYFATVRCLESELKCGLERFYNMYTDGHISRGSDEDFLLIYFRRFLLFCFY